MSTKPSLQVRRRRVRFRAAVGAALSLGVLQGAFVGSTFAFASSIDSGVIDGTSLSNSISTAGGIFVVSEAEGFWQLLAKPNKSNAWALLTPPGVSSQPGLTLGVDGSAHHVAVGFLSVPELGFSAVESLRSNGAWTSELVPHGLIASPEAMAVNASNQKIAITQSVSNPMVYSSVGGGSWRLAFNGHELSRRSVMRGCGTYTLDGVNASSSTTFAYLLNCGGKSLRVLGGGGGGGALTELGSVKLPRGPKSHVVDFRWVNGQAQVTATSVTAHHRRVTIYFGLGGHWKTTSFVVPTTGTVSAAIGPTGTPYVFVSGGRSRGKLIDIVRSRPVTVQAPPKGTVSVSYGDGSGLYAFDPVSQAIDIYQLSSPFGHTWIRYQQVALPQLSGGNPAASG